MELTLVSTFQLWSRTLCEQSSYGTMSSSHGYLPGMPCCRTELSEPLAFSSGSYASYPLFGSYALFGNYATFDTGTDSSQVQPVVEVQQIQDNARYFEKHPIGR